jgi:hypothetical protein
MTHARDKGIRPFAMNGSIDRQWMKGKEKKTHPGTVLVHYWLLLHLLIGVLAVACTLCA